MQPWSPNQLNQVASGSAVPPPNFSGQAPGGSASVAISNASPWALAWVDQINGTVNIPAFTSVTLPTAGGMSFQLIPTSPMFSGAAYLAPTGLSVFGVSLAYSATASPVTYSQIFSVGLVEISNTGSLSVTGNVTIDGTPTVDLASGASVIVEPGTSPVDISGTVSFAAGQSVTIEPGTSPIDISGSVDISGGSIAISGTPTVDITGGSIDVSSGNITIVGGQGSSTNVSVDSPPLAASANLVVASGGSSDSVTLTPPLAATGFVLVTVGNGVAQPSFTASGEASLNIYAAITYPVGGSGTIVGVVEGAVENIIFQVSDYTNSSSLPATAAYVAWLFGSGVQQVVNDVYQPLYVQGSRQSPTAVGNTLAVSGQQGASSDSLQTSSAPPQHVLGIAHPLTSIGTFTLISGAAGTQIRVRLLAPLWNVNGAASGSIQSSSGVVLWEWNATAGQPTAMDFEGFALPSGDSLNLVVQGSGGVYINGTITYDQY